MTNNFCIDKVNTMLKLEKQNRFDWDKGNLDKSYRKHGVTPNQAEEAFLDETAIILKDVKHSQKETRYLLIGKNANNKILFIVFTMREKKIRIISARAADKKESRRYAEKT